VFDMRISPSRTDRAVGRMHAAARSASNHSAPPRRAADHAEPADSARVLSRFGDHRTSFVHRRRCRSAASSAVGSGGVHGAS